MSDSNAGSHKKQSKDSSSSISGSTTSNLASHKKDRKNKKKSKKRNKVAKVPITQRSDRRESFNDLQHNSERIKDKPKRTSIIPEKNTVQHVENDTSSGLSNQDDRLEQLDLRVITQDLLQEQSPDLEEEFDDSRESQHAAEKNQVATLSVAATRKILPAHPRLGINLLIAVYPLIRLLYLNQTRARHRPVATTALSTHLS